MDGLESHIIDIAMTAIGSAVFGLIGFVWRISHKVNDLDKRIANLQDFYREESRRQQKDIDYMMSKVDNHNDKMYSIVKNMKD